MRTRDSCSQRGALSWTASAMLAFTAAACSTPSVTPFAAPVVTLEAGPLDRPGPVEAVADGTADRLTAGKLVTKLLRRGCCRQPPDCPGCYVVANRLGGPSCIKIAADSGGLLSFQGDDDAMYVVDSIFVGERVEPGPARPHVEAFYLPQTRRMDWAKVFGEPPHPCASNGLVVAGTEAVPMLDGAPIFRGPEECQRNLHQSKALLRRTQAPGRWDPPWHPEALEAQTDCRGYLLSEIDRNSVE
jgi:hypothetical protein